MMLPDYWLQRPKIKISSQSRGQIDHLLSRIKPTGANTMTKVAVLWSLADQQLWSYTA